MLWVDRYRPRKMSELDAHKSQNCILNNLAHKGDIPHLLIYGPSGSGKKTRAMALLNELYGPTVYNVRMEYKTVQVTDSKSIEIAMLNSLHHIDLNPSDAGNYDRVIIMHTIREIAQTAPMHSIINLRSENEKANASYNISKINPSQNSIQTVAESAFENGKLIPNNKNQSLSGGSNEQGSECRKVCPFKIIILNEVDKMTRPAQQALRRTMEKYISTCRLILLCTSPSRLIPPLRSRCLSIRIPAMNMSEIRQIITKVWEAENLTGNISEKFLETLHRHSEGNVRRALLMLEASIVHRIDLSGSDELIPLPDWKLYLLEITNSAIAEQSPKRLYEIRLKLYELLSQCISGDSILKELLSNFINLASKIYTKRIISLAAEMDHNMKLGSKPIIHLEAFIAGVMQIIKN